jgi:hypothetical protein
MADKVEQITGVIGDPKSWAVAERGGELVQVELRKGVRVRMYKSEAIAKGLWKEPEQEARGKRQEPVRNKARRPGRNKGA